MSDETKRAGMREDAGRAERPAERADPQALSDVIANEVLRQLGQRTASIAPPAPDPAPEHADSAALHAARQLKDEGGLTEDVLLAAARRGETRFVAATLAVAADVSLAAVDRACSLRSAKGLISLAWQAGFSMRAAGLLQGALGRLSPGAILPAGPGETFPLAIEEMRWQVEFLTRTER